MPVMNIAQLVSGFNHHMQDAVKSNLIQRTKDSSIDLFSQQHEKIAGRLHRRIRFLCQIDAVVYTV